MDPRIYRIAPELRRSALYVMVGFALLVPVAYWVEIVAQNRDPLSTAVVCSVFGAIALAMIVPLRWALHVDGCGVARRWLIGWDVWSWDDFSSGRIAKRHPITFVDPQRPWWRRRLRIDYIGGTQLTEVIGLINERYRLPQAPAVAESLRIKYGFRRSVEFNGFDIRLTVRGGTHLFTWNDVQRLRITRVDPKRRDFKSLELSLPGHEIELNMVTHQGGTSPTWSGADAEEVNEFLLQHVSLSRVVVELSGDRPTQVVDVEKQLAHARNRVRDVRILSWCIVVVICAWTLWMAIEKGALAALAITALGSLYAPVIWYLRKLVRERSKELEKWRLELKTERATGTTNTR